MQWWGMVVIKVLAVIVVLIVAVARVALVVEVGSGGNCGERWWATSPSSSLMMN